MRSSAIKPVMVQLLRRVPMPVIAMMIGLVAGVVVWAGLDQIQGRAVSKIFNSELRTQLALRSRESFVRFDRYIANFASTTRLLANHRYLAEYLDDLIWFPDEEPEPLIYRDIRPSWLPNSVERSDMPSPSHVLLIDNTGGIREIYQSAPVSLFSELTDRALAHFVQLAEVRTLFVPVAGRPYLLIGDRIEDSEGFPMGSLIVIVPIDAAFLAASQEGLLVERVAVALINGDDGRLIASIEPQLLTPGSRVDDWQDDYLITSQPLPQYEGSDWDLLFATFISHASVERMSRHVRSFEWRQRAIAAAVFILVFTLVIYLVSVRLNSVLKRMSRFSHRALGIEQPGFRRGGNQLLLLEEWIQQFTHIVLKARQELSRRYESEMRETEALKAAIMEASLDSIVTLDGQGRIVEYNGAAERALGLRRHQDLGQPFAQRVMAEVDRASFERLLALSRSAQHQAGEPHVRDELLATRHDGSAMPVELSIVPIDVDEQSFYTVYMHDVTERREAEREIKSLARFASESPHPILRVNDAGLIVFANRAALPLLDGWGTTQGARLPDAWFQHAAEALAAGEPREHETTLDGQVYALLFAPIRDLGYVNIYARDITAVRRAEHEARKHQAELVHVCRLSTLGEVATGMAHELNQPLSAIVNFANGASRRLQGDNADPEALIQAMSHITMQAERAGEIIRRLRALVAKQPPLRSEVDLNHLVREVCSFVEYDTERLGLIIALALESERIPVNVDLVQVEQVLLNLVRNALDALEAVPPANRSLRITTRADGAQAEVVVEDSGPGIPETQLAHLFDPFFTTKDSGMGMGLTISQTIVEDHEGRIWAESEPWVATRVHVLLPIATAATCQLDQGS